MSCRDAAAAAAEGDLNLDRIVMAPKQPGGRQEGLLLPWQDGINSARQTIRQSDDVDDDESLSATFCQIREEKVEDEAKRMAGITKIKR